MAEVSDLADMRRRAARQAGYGNYWAGKTVGLIDRLTRHTEPRAVVTVMFAVDRPEAAAAIRRSYRMLRRRRGLGRHDARLVAAGFALAWGEPVVVHKGRVA